MLRSCAIALLIVKGSVKVVHVTLVLDYHFQSQSAPSDQLLCYPDTVLGSRNVPEGTFWEKVMINYWFSYK